MTPQELKNSILQLAIQGKLVEQRPEEGTAKELYQKILLERYKLQQNKKIKKVPDFSIVADNIPFEVPENWSWSNIETLTYAVGNKQNQIQTKEILPEGSLPVVSQGQSLIDGYTNQKEKAIDDLPLVMFGDHTRNVKFIDFPFAIGADGAKFHKCILVYPQYIYYWMTYASGRLRNRGYARHYVLLKEQYIPLPPLAEQKRIVAKIEELLPYIDRYEAAWTKLEDFNKRFPVDMQKSILQYAIQGKLVEQRPEEGTGEDLYQQIQKEKQRLIKEGKIKKEKPLPEITEDEIPFDIPESWKWVRVIDIAFLNSGNQYDECSDGALYIKVADMNLPENQYEICTSTRRANVKATDVIPVGSIIFPKRGGAIATNKKRLVLREPICVDSNTMAMTIITGTILPYLSKWFYSIDLGKLATGTSVPQINNKDIYPLLIPLPPLAEQKRIVAKLEEILPLCEKLKK